jgi:hypothetical protein
MLEKKKIILLTALILSIVVAILMIYKSSAVLTAYQRISEVLTGLGSTLEAQGVNSSLAYLSVALSIIIGVVAILGSLLAFTDIKVKDIKIGPIILIAMAVITWIGIYIPVISTSFTYKSVFFSVYIDLVETLIGIGEPIILTISGVLALLAVFVLSE